MCSPTVLCSLYAQYGFDGSRHAQLLGQLHKAMVGSVDWILIRSLLTRCRLRVHRRREGWRTQSPQAFLPYWGGGVRGLPPSTSHYSLCPRILDQRFTASNPGTALDVHHSLLELCRVVCGHDLLVARGCNQARGAQLGLMLEQMLAQEGLMGCPPPSSSINRPKALFMQFACDAQRLALVDTDTATNFVFQSLRSSSTMPGSRSRHLRQGWPPW